MSQYNPMPEPPPPKTRRQKFKEYPKQVFFIFGNEVCERFSYYGLQTVLTLYIVNILNFNDVNATALSTGFGVLAYAFAPIIGCILADGYLGKFHTILWVSLLYAVGNIILAFASMQKPGASVHPWLDIIGLVVIALGTGGIKPNVMSFGADQFKKGQEKELEQFFSIFYFCINGGSVISTFLSPIFRTQSCLGEATCYPLAFGIPAILMVVANGFYIFGSFWYQKKGRPQGTETIFGKCARVIYRAIQNKNRFDIQREHWLYHYMDDHMCAHDEECRAAGKCVKEQFVKDLRAVLRVLVMFLPMPVFWALYNQNGTLWVLQGTTMDGRIGSSTFLPDQVQTANPILIMIFIPIFSGLVYPLMEKVFRVTPLRKMCIGGMLAALAYVAIGFIQLGVNKTLPNVPSTGLTRIEFVSYADCGVHVYLNGSKSYEAQLQQNETHSFDNIEYGDYTYTVTPDSTTCTTESTKHYTTQNGDITTENRKAYYGIIAPVYDTKDATWGLKVQTAQASLAKSQVGEGNFVINVNYLVPLTFSNYQNVTVTLCRWQNDNAYIVNTSCSTGSGDTFNTTFNVTTPDAGSTYHEPTPGRWHIILDFDYGENNSTWIYYGNFTVDKQGGIYTLTIYGPKSFDDNENYFYPQHQLSEPNSFSILYQLIPYVIISVAEIFLSITGYEFSYTQAPASMKSIILAAWLFMIGVGNIIIIGIEEAQPFENMAYQYFLFAGIMFLVMLIFIAMCIWFYEYVYHISGEEESAPQTGSETDVKTI